MALLLGMVSLAVLPKAGARRELRATDLWCCTANQPCWGWGDKQGQCCSSANNYGCVPSAPCTGGVTPQTFQPLCGVKSFPTQPITTDTQILAAAVAALAVGQDPAAAWLVAVRARVTASAAAGPNTPGYQRLMAAEAALAAGQDPAAAWLNAGGGPATAGRDAQQLGLGGIYSTYHYYSTTGSTQGLYCQVGGPCTSFYDARSLCFMSPLLAAADCRMCNPPHQDAFNAQAAANGVAFAQKLLKYPWASCWVALACAGTAAGSSSALVALCWRSRQPQHTRVPHHCSFTPPFADGLLRHRAGTHDSGSVRAMHKRD